ncbi:SBBP repeat-containing protein [Leptospira kmetyi]|uniref:Beta-propeller repeat protein n=1 Tax=Leptospira kmetyi TaxID=408139 RepID=A0ABX4NAG0_9LEPT|nr:SBBP repeat-containing protein [Leptospira kmetyi]PJZ28400.1 hypothetical protein CH378_18165 [Leptospira kmetyi]
MNKIRTLILKLFLALIIIGNSLYCKHDKKGVNDLELLSVLQILSGFSLPGPKPEWTRLFGGNGSGIQGNSITSDSNNNVYIAGQVSGSIDGQIITGFYDLFITKYNSSGLRQWTHLMGVSTDETIAYSITSDQSGNTYIVGETNGALDGATFIGTPDFADRDLFIVKFDTNGSKQWTRLLGIASGGLSSGKSVTIDSVGNIYVTGTATTGFDGLSFSGGGSGYFIVKFNSSGTKIWSKLFSGPRPFGIVCDNSGRIYITGSVFNVSSLDGVPLSGVTDSFLIQFDNNGNKLWTRLTGITGKDTKANALSIDSSGNVYITGNTTGSIDNQVMSGGLADLLVLKYDSNGNRLWARQLGFAGTIFSLSGKKAEGKGIAIGKNQDLYVTGYTNGNLDKQLHSDASDGKNNIFVTKYDLSGNKIWTSISGTKGFDSDANAITVDQQGHPYITGNTNGILNGEALIGNGSNLFIIKY